MLEFNTAINADHPSEDDESFGFPIETKVDGYLVEFQPPSSGQVAMLFAISGAKFIEQAGTFINFFFSVLPDEQTKAHFRARLFDASDQFGPSTIAEIVKALMEEWSANPTEEGSGSPDSPPPSGAKSTAKRRSVASTR
jgi:alkanesulfonate monooxygenase SsuD/methylene tetrahydromethanopterin reductase-like flavin-dependent oxidoreductase (luciferase family)